MEELKRDMILAIVKYLQEELLSVEFQPEARESIEVAMQCLQSTFSIDNPENERYGVINLREILQSKFEEGSRGQEAETLKEKGNDAMKHSDYEVALKCYSEAITLNPKNSKYYCNRAAAYEKLKMHLDAIQDCKEAIRLNPTYGRAYYRLGNALMALGRYTEARDEYSNAVKFEKFNLDYHAAARYCSQQIEAQNKKNNGNTNQNQQNQNQNRSNTSGNSFSDLMNNTEILNLTTQLLSNPNCVRNLVSNIMTQPSSNQDVSDPNIDNLAQIFTNGIQLGAVNPETVEEFIASISSRREDNHNEPKPDAE